MIEAQLDASGVTAIEQPTAAVRKVGRERSQGGVARGIL